MDEPRKRHPVGLFDAHAKSAFTSAQRDAETRGGKVLVSGLILYAGAKARDAFSSQLLEILGCDLDKLSDAVDAEWSAQPKWLQDQPVTLLRDAFQSVADGAPPDAELHLAWLLAEVLGYPDSMASRVIKRMGGEPAAVADSLRRT